MNKLDPNFQIVEADADTLDLSSMVNMAVENRKMIILIVCACLLFGTLYSVLARKVYRADILVQVEDNSSATTTGSLLSSIAPLLNMTSTADGEIQLLGSRLVVSKAVDDTHLYIDAQPQYFPLIGRLIAEHNPTISTPGLFGLGGYAWGAESIDVDAFNVPSRMEGHTFEIKSLADGRYEL